MKKIFNDGFIEPTITEDNYVLGAGQVDEEVLQENGQWDEFLPTEEKQKLSIETYNCTAFHTINPVEILIKRKFGKDTNWSDRALGILAGTYPPGNDPHTVAESLRKSGLLEESLLPFTKDIKNVDEYFAPKPLPNSILKIAYKFFESFSFRHEWVFSNKNTPLKEKQEKLMQALTLSPLGVSVRAWDKDGEYYVKEKGEQDTHWTTLYGFQKGKYWKVFDSYPPFTKKLAWDYDFGYAKRYWIGESNHAATVSILTAFRDLLKTFLNYLIYKREEEVEKAEEAEPVPNPQKKTPSEILYETARMFIGLDASPNDLAPDELGCAESVNAIYKKAFGKNINDENSLSTYWMYRELKNSPDFESIIEPEKGAIIISPTGYGNGKIKNGHVGICGIGDKIMSSSSIGNGKGKWLETHTQKTWRKFYQVDGGYPVHLFRCK